MTDLDLVPFLAVFKSITMVFPLRGEAEELHDMGVSYFKALRYFPLDRVKRGAENYMAFGKKFPKPIDWIQCLPKEYTRPELPTLTPREIHEWLRAERLMWEEDEPCHCEACRAAGVDHKFPRFVPEFTEDDREDRAVFGNREVVKGHWAHGEELRCWHVAKDKFWADFHALADKWTMDKTEKTKKTPFEQRLEDIFKKRPRQLREPGEEG